LKQRKLNQKKTKATPKRAWLALANWNDLWFVAVSRDKPPSHAFTFANMSFRPVPIRELDYGYRLAKSLLLRSEIGIVPRRRRSKKRSRRDGPKPR
jgi:hypothetical protein